MGSSVQPRAVEFVVDEGRMSAVELHTILDTRVAVPPSNIKSSSSGTCLMLGISLLWLDVCVARMAPT